jgi:hypothetical protein
MKITRTYEIPGTREYDDRLPGYFSFKGAWIAEDDERAELQITLYAVHRESIQKGAGEEKIAERIRNYCQSVLRQPEPDLSISKDPMWRRTVMKAHNENNQLARKLLEVIEAETFELHG